MGTTVNGFQINRCNITGNGDDAANDESGVDLHELTGSASGGANPTSITNTNNGEFELQIANTSGTLTDLQMSGNSISSNGLQLNHGNLVNFQALRPASMTLNVTSGLFTGNTDTSGGKIVTATGLQCDHSGSSGTMTCNISGSTFTNNNVGPQASVSNGGNMVADFNNVIATGNRSHGVNFFIAASYTGSFGAKLRNSTVGTLGTAGSGSQVGFAVRLQNESISTSAVVKVAVTNTIVQENVRLQPHQCQPRHQRSDVKCADQLHGYRKHAKELRRPRHRRSAEQHYGCGLGRQHVCGHRHQHHDEHPWPSRRRHLHPPAQIGREQRRRGRIPS